VVATPDDIYRTIVAKVGAGLSAIGVASNRVSLTDFPRLEPGSDFFVQVRASGGPFRVPRQNSGLVRERVEVTTWVRQALDPSVEQSIAFTREGGSVLSRVDVSRVALQGSYLDALLEVPLRLVSVGAPVVAPGGDGAVRVTDIYECEYEWGSPYQLRLVWSATAPTTLVGATVANLDQSVSVDRTSGADQYVWCLQPVTGGPLGFWGEGGRALDWYSNTNEPPSGPACGTVTIGGIVYRRWRSPYPSAALSAVYRVREV
jgi:hypothetical protein